MEEEFPSLSCHPVPRPGTTPNHRGGCKPPAPRTVLLTHSTSRHQHGGNCCLHNLQGGEDPSRVSMLFCLSCTGTPLHTSAAKKQLLMLMPEQVSWDVLLVLSLRKLREAYGVNEVVTALLRPWWLWHLGHIGKTAFPSGCPLGQRRKVKWLWDGCEDTPGEVVHSGADVCDQQHTA